MQSDPTFLISTEQQQVPDDCIFATIHVEHLVVGYKMSYPPREESEIKSTGSLPSKFRYLRIQTTFVHFTTLTASY